MGDFNIDLLKPNAEFEGVIYGNNMIPTITLATHEKPGCKPSLIDRGVGAILNRGYFEQNGITVVISTIQYSRRAISTCRYLF